MSDIPISSREPPSAILLLLPYVNLATKSYILQSSVLPSNWTSTTTIRILPFTTSWDLHFRTSRSHCYPLVSPDSCHTETASIRDCVSLKGDGLSQSRSAPLPHVIALPIHGPHPYNCLDHTHSSNITIQRSTTDKRASTALLASFDESHLHDQLITELPTDHESLLIDAIANLAVRSTPKVHVREPIQFVLFDLTKHGRSTTAATRPGPVPGLYGSAVVDGEPRHGLAAE
jgi:hypothetical protein